MKIFPLLLFVLWVQLCSAQYIIEGAFGSSTYDYATSGIESSVGNFIISANFDDSGILLKLNEQGDSIWSNQFNWEFGNIEIKNVIETQDGGYVINGYYIGTDNSFLFKTNDLGDSLWYTNITLSPNHTFNGVAEDLDGNIILTSYSEFWFQDQFDIQPKLYKFSSQGSLIDIFYVSHPDPGLRLRTVFVDSNNDYILSGEWIDQAPPLPGMMKYDSEGEFRWKFFQYCGLEGVVNDIEQDTDLGYIGIIEDTSMPSDSSSIMKFSSNGESEWIKKYKPFEKSIELKKIIKTENGFVIAGDNRRNCVDSCETDIFLFSINNSYELEWSATFGGPGDDFVSDMSITQEGNFLVVGHASNFNNEEKGIYVLILDSDGELIENEELNPTEVITLYPNPFSQKTTISFGEILTNAEFSIFNTKGQLIFTDQNINGSNYEFLANQLSAGLYLYNLEENGLLIGKGRLIIE